MSQIPDGNNRNDATFLTTPRMAQHLVGSARGRSRKALMDSSNGGREVLDLGEDSEFPVIEAAPRSGIPDSHNPSGY